MSSQPLMVMAPLVPPVTIVTPITIARCALRCDRAKDFNWDGAAGLYRLLMATAVALCLYAGLTLILNRYLAARAYKDLSEHAYLDYYKVRGRRHRSSPSTVLLALTAPSNLLLPLPTCDHAPCPTVRSSFWSRTLAAIGEVLSMPSYRAFPFSSSPQLSSKSTWAP